MKLFSRKKKLEEEKEKVQGAECLNGVASNARGQNDSEITTASGFAATASAQASTEAATIKFAKPDKYTGNRGLYDSGAAKVNAKKKLFDSGKPVIDPYTGDTLVLTKQEAKLLYGDDWQRYLAESDHVKPLERIHEEYKSNPWITTENIKTAANSEDNIRVASRKFNNPKRSKTNKEYVEDTAYLEQKGVKLTEQGKKAAIRDGELADASINSQIKQSAIKNIIETGHKAGVDGAKNAGGTAATMSAIISITAVIKGEKTPQDALKDTAVDTGKAAATGYLMGNGLTTVAHTLSDSSSKFINALAKSNVPGKIITAVIVTGNTLKKYANGEISTQDCIIELGEKGLNFATAGYSMTIGQALVPIPIVGAAVGALVGAMATSKYYNELISTLKQKDIEHRERLRVIQECYVAAQQYRAFRMELESYLESYFKEYQDCFDDALSTLWDSYNRGDADGIIAGANTITYKLGGTVHYNTVDEFKEFISNNDVDQL